LRAISIIFVLLGHALKGNQWVNYTPGGIGVDIFPALMSYVIVLNLQTSNFFHQYYITEFSSKSAYFHTAFISGSNYLLLISHGKNISISLASFHRILRFYSWLPIYHIRFLRGNFRISKEILKPYK